MVTNNSGKCQDFDFEEVDSSQSAPMYRKKALPGRSRPLALRCGFDTVVIEDTLDRISVYGDSKSPQGIPGRAPLAFAEFLVDPYSAWISSVR